MTEYELDKACERNPDCGCDCAHCTLFAAWVKKRIKSPSNYHSYDRKTKIKNGSAVAE